MGSTGADTSGSTGAPDRCVADFEDDWGPTVQVTVVNGAAEPRYLLLEECALAPVATIEGLGSDPLPTRLPGCGTCSEFAGGGCVCPDGPCFAGRALRLDPGATYPFSVSATTFVARTLPEDCPGVDLCGVDCWQAQALADGTYEVSVLVGAKPACDLDPCDCAPDATGSCTVDGALDVFEPVPAAGTFTVPDPQPVEIVLE